MYANLEPILENEEWIKFFAHPNSYNGLSLLSANAYQGVRDRVALVRGHRENMCTRETPISIYRCRLNFIEEVIELFALLEYNASRRFQKPTS